MTEMTFMELGFPVRLVDPPMVEVRGQMIPNLNMEEVQETVTVLLMTKPGRLTGAEARFLRKRFRKSRADLARVLGEAITQTMVSQWESQEDEPSGMDHGTESRLRVWVANQVADRVEEAVAP